MKGNYYAFLVMNIHKILLEIKIQIYAFFGQTTHPFIKSKESNISISEEDSLEEEIFQQYIWDLQLGPKDINKMILGVGIGNIYFIKWANMNKVNFIIHNLNPFKKSSTSESVSIGSVNVIPMPDETFDLIVSSSVMPNININKNDIKEKVKKSFLEMLRVLKKGGEIRLSKVLLGNKYEIQMVLTDSINDSLEELKYKYNIEIKKIRTPHNDIYEYDKNNFKKNLLDKSFLVILKKSNIEKISLMPTALLNPNY